MADQENLTGELPPSLSSLPRLPIPQPAAKTDPQPSKLPENGAAAKPEPEEIVPAEWKPPPPVDFAEILPKATEPAPSPASARAPIELRGVDHSPAAGGPGATVPGVKPPVPPSPAEQAHILYLDRAINYEVNVYRLCFHAVHEAVLLRLHETPPDSADFDMWGPGKRSPLEIAEPHIAIEVYRQVRESARADERAGRREDTKALITRVLGGLLG